MRTKPIYVIPTSILFAVVLAVVVKLQKKSQPRSVEDMLTYERLEQLADETAKYHRMIGTWPTSPLSLLSAMLVKDTNILVDGWGREFVFRTHTNATNNMWVISYGADGLPGGIGTNADFVVTLPY